MSPDGSTNPPPEEKLLRLIRGKEAKPAAAAVAAPAGRPTPAATFRLSEAPQGGARRWARIAAVTFSALLGLEAAYLLFQLMRPAPVIQAPAVASIPVTAPSTADPTMPASIPPPEMPSLSTSATHPLFAAPGPVAGSTAASSTVPSVAAKTLAARLSLMGIISGNPAQAIIEDTQTKKTYFVTVGQAVVEGAMLQQVLDNRVILELQGEKIELTL